MYNDDNDLCLRLSRHGWKTACYPETVVHVGGGNADQLGDLTAGGRQVDLLAMESTYLYYRRNYGLARVLSQYLWRMAYRLARIVKRLTRIGQAQVEVASEVGQRRPKPGCWSERDSVVGRSTRPGRHGFRARNALAASLVTAACSSPSSAHA